MKITDTDKLVVLIVKQEDINKVEWIYANKIEFKDYEKITDKIEEVTDK